MAETLIFINKNNPDEANYLATLIERAEETEKGVKYFVLKG